MVYRILTLLLNIVDWLKVAIFPFAIGFGIALIPILLHPCSKTVKLGLIIVTLGGIFGIIWATKIWLSKKPKHYISKFRTRDEVD